MKHQNLLDLYTWSQVKGGEAILLSANKRRTVAIMVNAPSETMLMLQKQRPEKDSETGNITDYKNEGEPQYLTKVDGLEKIQFSIIGPYKLIVEGDMNFRLSEGQQVAIENSGKETFTKLRERAPRNLELERMNFIATQNAERRMAAVLDQKIKLMEAKYEQQNSSGTSNGVKAPEAEPPKQEGATEPAKPTVTPTPSDPKNDEPKGE